MVGWTAPPIPEAFLIRPGTVLPWRDRGRRLDEIQRGIDAAAGNGAQKA